MIGWHMFPQGGKTSASEVAWMDGDGFPVVEYLHHPFGRTNIYCLVDQDIRDRIAVLIKFDMVIDIHCGCFSLGIDIRLFGQWPQVRSIDLFELLAAGATHRLHDFVVQLFQLLFDRQIDIIHTKELAVPQRRNDPTFDILNPILNFSLIARLFYPGWQNCKLVVFSQILVSQVDTRLIVIGFGDPSL